MWLYDHTDLGEVIKQCGSVPFFEVESAPVTPATTPTVPQDSTAIGGPVAPMPPLDGQKLLEKLQQRQLDNLRNKVDGIL